MAIICYISDYTSQFPHKYSIFAEGKNIGGDPVSTGMVNPMWQAEVVGRPLKTPGTLTTADEQFALAA